jgi:hypothetical protein
MTPVYILIVAVLAYGLFAALRGATRINEAERQHETDIKMQAARDAIDAAADKDPTKL